MCFSAWLWSIYETPHRVKCSYHGSKWLHYPHTPLCHVFLCVTVVHLWDTPLCQVFLPREQTTPLATHPTVSSVSLRVCGPSMRHPTVSSVLAMTLKSHFDHTPHCVKCSCHKSKRLRYPHTPLCQVFLQREQTATLPTHPTVSYARAGSYPGVGCSRHA